MSTTETRQLVRLTNISDRNLGFSSPLRFLLRGEKRNFEPRLCTKVIFDDQVDANMRQWEAEGLLKIEPFKPKEKTAKVAKKPTKKVTKKAAKKSPAEGLKGDPQKPGFENLSEKDEPPNLQLNVTDKAKKPSDKADLLADNPPEPTDGTVASGFDGQPNTEESEKTGTDDDAAPPTLTEETNAPLPDPGIIYAREELEGMKMSDLRRVVESKKIEAKSTQKDVLTQAILDHQANQEHGDASS
ncbi:MAG: hypothetical protein V3W37_08625 [Candidatus Binatia bacterium]